MNKLFENWRNFKNEAQDPDSNSDDSAELKNMAPEINRAFIEKIIGDFSFNSGQSSQHRWSPRQPIIDYYFDERIGGWKYTATIPDGTNNADKWPTINSSPDEDIEEFLTRVEDNPQQLNLFETWRKYLQEQEADPDNPMTAAPEVPEQPKEETIESAIASLADEKMKQIKASPKKGQGTVVNCYGGDCIDQMIANEHAPLWSLYSLKQIIRKKYPKLLRKLKNVIKVDQPGKFGVYKQGYTKPMMGSTRSRKGDPKYIVVHSSTTNNPMRTVAALQARRPKAGLEQMQEERGKEHGGFSTNYEVYYDGTIYEYFPPDIVTTHAGRHNSYSIGIDLTGKPDQHTPQQISALQTLIDDLVSRYNIPYNVAPSNMKFKDDRELIRSAYGVVAHTSIAGGNRSDPGSGVMAALGASDATAVAMAKTRVDQKKKRIADRKAEKAARRAALAQKRAERRAARKAKRARSKGKRVAGL